MTAQDRLVDVALGEVGYLEKSKSAYIANPAVIWFKLDGAGYDNITKYAYELDQIDWYAVYVQYGAWCASYVDWCFIKAFGEPAAAKMKNHGIYDSLVDCAIDSYKAIGRWFSEPEKGDQIFFSKANGIDPAHTGIVTAVDDDYVYTVEGNTSSESGIVVANGGTCAKKWYRRNYYRILGYGRPLYEEVDDMDVSALIELIKGASPDERKALGKTLDDCVYEYRLKLDVPGWAEAELKEAVEMGITDGTRPMTYATRAETAMMCKREAKKK